MRIVFRAVGGLVGAFLVVTALLILATSTTEWNDPWIAVPMMGALHVGTWFIGYSLTGRESLSESIQAMLGGPDEVVVELFTDYLEAYTAGRSTTVRTPQPNLGKSQLIVDFETAQTCLSQAIEQLPGPISRLRGRPRLILIPMDGWHNGLDEVETQWLQDLGDAAGAGEVVVRANEATPGRTQ